MKTKVIKLSRGILAGKLSFKEFTIREALDRDEDEITRNRGALVGLELELALVARRVMEYAGKEGPMSSSLLTKLTDNDWILAARQVQDFDEGLLEDALKEIKVDGTCIIQMSTGITVEGATVTEFSIRETTLQDMLDASSETGRTEGLSFNRSTLARRITEMKGAPEGVKPSAAMFEDLTNTDAVLIRLQVEKFDGEILAAGMKEVGLTEKAGRK